MIIPDTNVISEVFRPSPEPRVVDWLASLTGDVAITANTLAELLAGAPISTADAQIAAICLANGATCATGNMNAFEYTGAELVDPWQADK